MSKLLAGTALLLSMSAANASWLDDAWPTDKPPEHGDPAITIHSNGVVDVVLPQQVLEVSGLDRKEAVTAFLNRYGPTMCGGEPQGDFPSLQVPHPSMHVELSIMRERYFDSPTAFYEVDKESEGMAIDYVPERTRKCIDPTDQPTS